MSRIRLVEVVVLFVDSKQKFCKKMALSMLAEILRRAGERETKMAAGVNFLTLFLHGFSVILHKKCLVKENYSNQFLLAEMREGWSRMRL